MKNSYFILFLFSSIVTGYTQSFPGSWEGILKLPGAELKIIFHIQKDSVDYYTTMDSPQQGGFDIAIKETKITGDSIYLNDPNLSITIRGKLKDKSTITSSFSQGAMTLPLELNRTEAKSLERPQEPKKPYTYFTEEIQFYNKEDNIKLSGTLNLPQQDGKFPAVILLSGSGPQDRDSNVYGHKLFLVLAHHLTKNGIAVLRYDDRGTAASTGDYATASLENFKTDAQAALNYLRSRKEINTDQLGFLGHSEGGLLASMLAAEDKSIAYAILLAAPGVPGDQLLISQSEAMHKAMGIPENQYSEAQRINQELYKIVKTVKQENIEKEIISYMNDNNITSNQQQNRILSELNSPEIQSLIKSDPAKFISKINCPVLALNGSADLQVIADLNLNGIRTALKDSGNTSVKIEKLDGLNHLFQQDLTGLPQHYAENIQTFSPTAMDIISQWIKSQTMH